MRTGRKRYKGWRRAAGCILAAAVFLSGCAAPEEEEPMVVVEQPGEGSTYEVVPVVRGDIVHTRQMRCIYRQLEDQEISFPVSGRLVRKVYVQEGDAVKKGDLLAELAGGNLDQDIRRLTYQIARNEKLLEYVDTNEELGISSLWVHYLFNTGQSEADQRNRDQGIEALQQSCRYQREDYEDAIALDQMELERLQEEKRQSRVYAGMSGTVRNMKERLEGSTSARGETVMTIIDNSRCIFVAESPELAEYFQEGERLPIELMVAAASHYEVLPYQMEEWGEKQTFIVAEDYDTGALEVGVTGLLNVVTDRREGVLTIPLRAVKKADDRTYVYVLNEDGMREVRWFEPGLYGVDVVEVVSGLEEGDEVIVR